MSKKQELRERRRKEQQKKRMITIGAIIVGAGLVAAALIYPSTQVNDSHFASRYMANDNAMGNPDAPIQIVEYADYKCGHCGDFTVETEPLLVENYVETDKVYFVSRSVGAMLSGAEPMLAAEAAYCAGEQNMYWEMHDIIFSNQLLTFTNSLVNNWAKTIGIPDLDQFKSCLSDGTYEQRAFDDQDAATAEGISGTPSFVITYFVDGQEIKQLLPGNYPYASFQQAIEEGLTAMGLQ